MYSLGQEMGPVHCFSIWAWCQVCILSPKSALTLPTLFCLVLMTAQLGTFVVLRSKWQTIDLHEWKPPWSYGWTPRVILMECMMQASGDAPQLHSLRACPVLCVPAQEQQLWRLAIWDPKMCILNPNSHPSCLFGSLWFSCCTYVWSTSYAHTSQILNHRFVIFKGGKL